MTSNIFPNPVVRGALWMVLATGFQATASGFVRRLSNDFSVFELVFFFSSISAVLLIPFAMTLPKGSLRNKEAVGALYYSGIVIILRHACILLCVFGDGYC